MARASRATGKPMSVQPTRPRLLIVTGIFPPDLGGPASYVPRMAAALHERGWKVEVICLSDSLDHDDSRFPFPVERIARRTSLPFRILQTTLTVWRAAARADVVYVNGLGCEASLGAFLAGRPAVHKIVGDYAWERAASKHLFDGTIDDYQHAPKSPMLRIFDAIRTTPQMFARELIVPSHYLARIVRGWGIPEEKIRVIYNAVPAHSTAPALTTLPAWSGKTLITVCRLVRWKGIDPLIRTLTHLPDTRLVITGGGPLEKEFRQLATDCGVADRVIWLGNVPSGAVAGYLRQADAFVLNSTYEGLPHVVLEAMQAGTPVIATHVGGTGEVVIDGETGLLIEPNDSAALQAAISRLWSEPELGTRLAREASLRLSRQFNFDSMLDATDATLLRATFPPASRPTAPFGAAPAT